MTEAAPHSLVRTLRGASLLEGCSDEALLEVVGRSANLRWEEGEIVFAAGDPADELFVVVRGTVILASDDGDEVRRGPGEHLGGDALEEGGRYRHHARIAEEAELMVIPREAAVDVVGDVARS